MRHTPGPWKVTGEGMNDYEVKHIKGRIDTLIEEVTANDPPH